MLLYISKCKKWNPQVNIIESKLDCFDMYKAKEKF